MKKEVQKSDNKLKKQNKSLIIALAVTASLLTASTIGFGVAYGVTQAKANDYGVQLENVYQKNLYDLVESVNNTEVKLGKVLASDGSAYQKKMLLEVSQNAELAESSISSLPISQNDLADSVKFINQMSGYTKTLSDKLAQGGKLAKSDVDTLEKMHASVVDMKEQINAFVRKVQADYSILEKSLDLDGDYNNFTLDIAKIKGDNVDYPAMIYDGPFSDSSLEEVVKGLKGEELTKEECQKEVEKTFKNYADISYAGEINSKFETYTYHVTNTDDQTLFVQVTKVGGNVITVSGSGSQNGEDNISVDDAKKIALDFVKENGIENPQIVWQDSAHGNIYLNIAPTENGIVLYPDLVKVKVDLSSGNVIGYDSSSYFLNHIPRALTKPNRSAKDFESKIPQTYEIAGERLVLAPLDYDREVICFEYECDSPSGTYYFYLNADTGEEENVLKVVETENGNKLM